MTKEEEIEKILQALRQSGNLIGLPGERA